MKRKRFIQEMKKIPIGINFEQKYIGINEISLFIGVLGAQLIIVRQYLAYIRINLFPNCSTAFSTLSAMEEASMPSAIILFLSAFSLSFMLCVVVVISGSAINRYLRKILIISSKHQKLFVLSIVILTIVFLLSIAPKQSIIPAVSISLLVVCVAILHKNISFGAKILIITPMLCFLSTELFKRNSVKDSYPFYVYTSIQKYNKVVVCDMKRHGDIVFVRTSNDKLYLTPNTILYFESIPDGIINDSLESCKSHNIK